MIRIASRFASHQAFIRFACCCASLPTRSCTVRSQLLDESEAIYVIAALDVVEALVDGLENERTLSRVEVLVDGNQLELGALGEVSLLPDVSRVLRTCA